MRHLDLVDIVHETCNIEFLILLAVVLIIGNE